MIKSKKTITATLLIIISLSLAFVLDAINGAVSVDAQSSGATVSMVGPDQVTRNYSLKSHPRVWLDGPDGLITTRLKDPDGSGPLKNENYDKLPAQGIVIRLVNNRTTCIVDGQIKNCRGVFEMASDAALLWWMCNQCNLPWDNTKTWLDFSKDLYLNMYDYGFKRWFGSHKFGDALAPDAGDDPSGMTDFGGPYGAIASLGYSVIRDQLTPEERTTIARYFVNGILPEDYCSYPSVRLPIKIAKNSSTVITSLSGSWPAGVEVGEWVDIKAYKDSNGEVLNTNQAPNGYWSFSGIVKSKTQDTITMNIGSGGSWMPNFQEGYMFLYPDFNENTCGMMSVFAMHSDTPRYSEPQTPTNTRALAEDIPAIPWDVTDTDGVTQVIRISDTSTWNIPGFTNPSPESPWKAVIGGGDWGAELVLIEGISGGDVTIRRGLYHHTERTHIRCASWDPPCTSPRGITVLSKVSFGTRNYNTGLNNRELTRAQSFLAIGLAFADDDPRAATLLERAGSYFSTDSHKWAERFFTLTNYSIASYQYGRGVYYGRMAMFLENSIETPSVDYYDTGHNMTDQYLVYPYWGRPWAMKEVVEPGLDGNWHSCYWTLNAQRDCGQLAFMAQLTHPGSDEAKYSWAFLTTDSGYTLGNSASDWAGTDYYGEGMIGWLALLAGYPDDIQSTANRKTLSTTYARTNGDSQSPGGSGFKIAVSRTNWETDATYGFFIAQDAFSDKLTGEGTLVSYGIGKNGWLIYSPGFRQRFSNNFHNNQVDFGDFTKAPYYLACTPTAANLAPEGLCNHHNYPSYSTARPDFLWVSSDMTNLKKGGAPSTLTDLHGLTKHWRQFVHVKASGSGTKDYFFLMDDIAKTVNEKYRIRTMYPQNGETVTMANNSRTYTEGSTSISPNFDYVESTTGGDEGPVSKIISKWTFTGGATVNAVYDMPVKVTNSTSNSQTVTVCADATESQPCRIKVGDNSYTFTSPVGTLTYNPSDNGSTREIALTFDHTTGTVNVRWDAGIPTTPTCGGAVVCIGEIGSARGDSTTAALSNGELLLLRYKWSFSGAPYDGCMHDQTMRTGSPPFHNGTCNQIAGPVSGFSVGKFDNARGVMVEAAPGTGGRLWQVHRATSNMAETLNSGTVLSVSGTGANHEAYQIDDGDNSVVVVLPISNTRATSLTVNTTHSGSARVMFSGLQEGTYNVQRNGVNIRTGVSVPAGDSALMVSDVSSGEITATRSSGVTGNLQLNPNTLPVSCEEGSGQFNQSVGLSAVGATLTSWSAALVSPTSWLAFSPSSGVQNTSVGITINCTGLSAGSYQSSIRFSSSQENITNSPVDLQISLTVSNGEEVDSQAPSISGVATSSVTQSSIVISWNTDESSDTQVEYGLTQSYGSNSVLKDSVSKVTSHSVTLSGLIAGTSYNFRVKSRDASGNLAASSNYTFVTSQPDESSEVPTVSNVRVLNISTSSATISWSTSIAASAQVQYGILENSVPYKTGEINNDSTDHSITLTKLIPCAKYRFQARSFIPGQESLGAIGSFVTYGCPGSASPLSELTQQVYKNSGGNVELSTIQLTVPTSVSSEDSLFFQIKKFTKDNFSSEVNPPSGKKYSNAPVYRTSVFVSPTSTASDFSKTINITFSYTDDEIDGLDESTLKLYRYSNDVWSELSDCSINATSNTITCSTPGFSDIVLVGEQSSSPQSDSGGSSSGGGGGGGSSSGSSSGVSTSVTIGGASTQGGGSSVSNPNKYAGIKALTVNTSFGSKHPDVLSLQRFLIVESLLSSDSATGFFGVLTEGAIKKFQVANNIVSSGSPLTTGYGAVGPKTRAKINGLIGVIATQTKQDPVKTTTTTVKTTPKITPTKLTKNIYKGMTGGDVVTLQNVLIKEGFLAPGNNTGIFGPLTEAALKAFQKKYNIVISGTATTTGFGATGPKTRAKINELGGY